MKKAGLLMIFMICNLLSADSQSVQVNEKTRGVLNIVISGLDSDQGNVKIGLCNSAESWDDKAEKYMGAILPIKNGSATWIVKGLPFGQYAVKFYHDENNDDILNRNIVGMPKETYGFYMHGKNKYVPPDFATAKFNFKIENMTIELKN